MKTLIIRSPTASPPSPTNNNNYNTPFSTTTSNKAFSTSSPSQQQEQAFYDESEQFTLISSYYQNASIQYKLYSYSIGIVSALCSSLFFYFALIGEDFGEGLGLEKIRLLHSLSSIGLLCLSVRCFYRYNLWKQSNFNLFINGNMDINGNTINGNVDNNGNMDNSINIENTSNLLNSIQLNNNITINSNNNSTNYGYFNTPSTILTDHPIMYDGDDSNSNGDSNSILSMMSTPSQVIENSKEIPLFNSGSRNSLTLFVKVPQILFVCLFVAILVAVLQILLWTPTMLEHYQLLLGSGGVEIATSVGGGEISVAEHFKLAILVFPLVLPIMIVASEYGHYLLNQNFVDIIDLNNHRYKFKKL